MAFLMKSQIIVVTNVWIRGGKTWIVGGGRWSLELWPELDMGQ